MKRIAALTLTLALALFPLSLRAETYAHISTTGNTVVKATPGVLNTLVINTTASGTITIVDTTATNCSGGATIASFAASTAVGTYNYAGVNFYNGLCVTTGAAYDLTVSFH